MPVENISARLNRVTLLKNIPLSAQLELTYRCPNSCVHCYLPETRGRADARSGRELATKDWKSVLRQLKDLGCLYLTLTGGEPLLRKDLVSLCRRASELNFEIKIFTSGAGLTPRLMEELRKSGVFGFELSFYGRPAVHDAVTGVKGSGQAALAAARELKKAGFRVKLKTPVMRATAGELKYVAALAGKNGFDRAFDPTLTIANDGETSNLARRSGLRRLKAMLGDTAINPVKKNEPFMPAADSPVCGAGRNIVCVSPYGDVFPCLQLQVKLGNIRRRRLNSIWTGSGWLKKWREVSVSDIKECRSCKLLDYCSRCPGISLLEMGDISRPYKTACQVARIQKRLSDNQKRPIKR